MTHSRHFWSNGEEDKRSSSYDFIEALPFWKTRWFLVGITAAGISILLVFWPFR
jgi:hypothetical protein